MESEQKIDLYECRVLTPAFKAWMEKRNVGTELSFQAEHSMPSGGRADIIVTIDGKKYLCELKSFRDNNDAEQRFKVRQAIGQLLEYSSWEKPSEYHGHFLVVDEIPDKTLQKYLTNIASHFDQKFNCYYQDANGNFSPLLKHHQLPF
ncbi:MAG: hypothetical protein EOP48_20505 [Sphingobacteriales bacterium]|nr:MAG: hypothetical protein EOP48_20505 [Sphingobacteriales bacterium]